MSSTPCLTYLLIGFLLGNGLSHALFGVAGKIFRRRSAGGQARV